MERIIKLPEATSEFIYPNLVTSGPDKMIIVYLNNDMVGFVEFVNGNCILVIGTETSDSNYTLEELMRSNQQYTYRLIER